jgi:hypothetical protein
VAAGFYDAPVLEHDDAVGAGDRREAVLLLASLVSDGELSA